MPDGFFQAVEELDAAAGGGFKPIAGRYPTTRSLPFDGNPVDWIGIEIGIDCLTKTFGKLHVVGRLYAGRKDGGSMSPRETRLLIDGQTKMILNDIPTQQDVYSLPLDQRFTGSFERQVRIQLLSYAPGYWSPAENANSILSVTPER